MKAERFLEELDRACLSYHSISKIRELILSLAVKGKICRQLESEQNSESLLPRILSDRELYRSAKGLKHLQELKSVAAEDAPYSIPQKWRWVRLGNLCRAQAGFAFESSAFTQGKTGVPLIRIRDIRAQQTQLNYTGVYRPEFLINKGDYLVGMDGEFKIAKWQGPQALLNQRVSRLQWYSQEIMPSFFCIAAQHQLSKLQGTKAYTTVDHLSTKQIEEAIVPLPPLAEQKRIVAKVDELMALCDRLEAQLKERDVKQAVLAKAALAKFTEDPTPENLQLLFHPSYTIEPEDMRSCVRSLAVLGELTSNLNAEKRLGWQPSPLGILCAFLNGDRSKNYPSKNTRVVSGVPFINAGHLSDGDVATDDMDYITEEHFNRLGGGKVQKGDVLYCLRGSLGKCAVVSSIERGAVASSLVILRPGSKLDANYLHLYLCSPAGRTLISKYDNGSAQPNLSAANVKKYLIELPPIEEQRRIVIRAKELISLVDELEAQIGASRTTGEKLLEAMVAELTAD